MLRFISDAFRIETSILISAVNQLTGLYMMTTLSCRAEVHLESCPKSMIEPFCEDS